ncbi:MAG: hypothetical protein J2P18_11815, partial [Nocardia sp.]|nr:hypothetical protein [Nocardia sp.]
VHAERTATEGQPPARERMGKDQYIRYRLDQEADAHAMEFAALDQLREILPDGDRIPVGKLERAYREAVEGALPEAADFYGRDVSGGAPDEAGRAEFLEAFAHDRGRDAIRPLMDGYRPDAAETLARKYAADWEAAHPNSKADRPDPFWGRYGVPGAVTIHSSTPLEHEYLRQTLHEEAVSAVATGDPRPQYPDVHDVSFTQGSGEYLSHQREEYIRQLDRQIEGLNRMTAAELIHNMDHVTRQGKAQEAARRIFRQEALGIELARARALARRDPGALGGLSPREYASRIVDERMRGLNALHEPDIHAGGQDVIGRTDDGLPSMGDDHVNSSIGTQWKERRAALRAYAEQMIADGAGDHRLNIRWHFDDEDPHPDSGGVPAWGEEPDAAEPALGAELPRRDVVAHLDGERVRLRLVDDGGGRWRVDSMEPVSGEYGRPTLESVRRPGPVRALWERLTGGYEGPNPKYPSGSGMDSDYQTDLTEDIGHLVGNHELEELGDHHLKTNYVRIAKESITLWRNRQRLPGIQHLSGRIDPLPAEHLPAWSEDGREYTPWLDEADPKAVEEVHEELHKAGLDHLVAESAPQDRPDTMVPDHSSAAPGHGPDDPVAGLRAEAARLGVPMTEISPRELRRVQDIVRYHNLRRIAVIEALRDAAHRFDAEQAKVPYRPVSVTDRNPMARYLKEVMLAHGDDPGLLDWNGANNGGESGRDFGPLTLDRSSERPWDDATDDGRDQGVRIFFENSLRRDQIRDERSTWAELAAVELSRLEPGELDRTLAELSEGVRERLADLADFTARADEFLDALPSEEIVRVPGDPERLLLLDVRADHDQVLAGAMDADPELAARLNDGDVRIEKWTPVVDADDAVAVRHLGEMRVRTVSADVGGRHLDALLVRDGDGPWRPVQRPPSTEPVAPEARSLAEIGAARDDLARSLGMDPDRLSAEQIDREMRANDMRAIRIEALVDDIGS